MAVGADVSARAELYRRHLAWRDRDAAPRLPRDVTSVLFVISFREGTREYNIPVATIGTTQRAGARVNTTLRPATTSAFNLLGTLPSWTALLRKRSSKARGRSSKYVASSRPRMV